MLKILLITIILVAFAVAGLAIRMLFDQKAEFSGGSCHADTDELREKGIACGCGGYCDAAEEDK